MSEPEAEVLREGARMFDEFIADQTDRGEDITPELERMPSKLRQEAYDIERRHKPWLARVLFNGRKEEHVGIIIKLTCRWLGHDWSAYTDDQPDPESYCRRKGCKARYDQTVHKRTNN